MSKNLISMPCCQADWTICSCVPFRVPKKYRNGDIDSSRVSPLLFFISLIAPIILFDIILSIPLGHLLVAIIATHAKFSSRKPQPWTLLVMLCTSAAYFYHLLVLVVSHSTRIPTSSRSNSMPTPCCSRLYPSVAILETAEGKASAALTDLMALVPSLVIIHTDTICI